MHTNHGSETNSESDSSEDRSTLDIPTIMNQKSNIADQRMPALKILPARHKIHKMHKSTNAKGNFAAMKNKFFAQSGFQKINQNCIVGEREMPQEKKKSEENIRTMASTQDQGSMAMVEHKKTVAKGNANLKAINAIFDNDSDDDESVEEKLKRSSIVFDEIESDLSSLEFKIRRSSPVVSMMVLNAQPTHVRILGHMIPLDDRPLTVQISNIPLLKTEGL
jgi:hypothetical protein